MHIKIQLEDQQDAYKDPVIFLESINLIDLNLTTHLLLIS